MIERGREPVSIQSRQEANRIGHAERRLIHMNQIQHLFAGTRAAKLLACATGICVSFLLYYVGESSVFLALLFLFLLLQALAMCQTPPRREGQCIREGWGWYPLSIACASGAICLISALSTPHADLTWNLILLAASLGALLVGILGEWTYPRWNRWHQ